MYYYLVEQTNLTVNYEMADSKRKLQKQELKKKRKQERRTGNNNDDEINNNNTKREVERKNDKRDEDENQQNQQNRQPELEVVKQIKQKGVQKTVEKYCLKLKRHKKHPNLLQLSYSQVRSSMGSPVVQECRGLVLDEEDNWRVISYPYKKFFNYGEPFSATLNWEEGNVRVYEKLDGSLMTLYWYKGEWHVASQTLPDASGKCNSAINEKNEVMEYAQLFWRTWNTMGYQLPHTEEGKTYCYMFEIISNLNQIIVKYETSKLILHGARNMKTFQEITPEEVNLKLLQQHSKWELPPLYQFSSLSSLIEYSKKLNPNENEGFVVCDKHFNRIKVKSPLYVLISYVYNNSNVVDQRRLLEVIRRNEGDEFLVYFPEMREMYMYYHARYQGFQNILLNICNQHQHPISQHLRKRSPIISHLILKLKSSKNEDLRSMLVSEKLKDLELYMDQLLGPDYGFDISKKSALLNDDRVQVMDISLQDLCHKLKPKNEVQENWKDFKNKLREWIKTYHNEIDIVPFGSVESDLATHSSDLDISLVYSPSVLQQFNITPKLNNAGEFVYFDHQIVDLLKKNGLEEIQAVETARYPIIKCYDQLLDVHCDLSFGNHIGAKKAEMLKYYCSLSRIGELFKNTILFFKHWANRRHLLTPPTFNYYNNNNNKNNKNNNKKNKKKNKNKNVIRDDNDDNDGSEEDGGGGEDVGMKEDGKTRKNEKNKKNQSFLNSYSLYLMILYFFQSRKLLPVLCSDHPHISTPLINNNNNNVNNDNNDNNENDENNHKVNNESSVDDVNDESGIDNIKHQTEKITKLMPTYEYPMKINSSKTNNEVNASNADNDNDSQAEISLSRVIIEIAQYYSRIFDYETNCISVRLGDVIPKFQTAFYSTKTPQLMCVEDPFILTENTARTIFSSSFLDLLCAEFNRLYILLSSSLSISPSIVTSAKEESGNNDNNNEKNEDGRGRRNNKNNNNKGKRNKQNPKNNQNNNNDDDDNVDGGNRNVNIGGDNVQKFDSASAHKRLQSICEHVSSPSISNLFEYALPPS